MRIGPFSFLFFFLFFSFCLSLFKTTKICFGSTKLVIFYKEKAFHAEKKTGKMTLPPLKNISLTPLSESMRLLLVFICLFVWFFFCIQCICIHYPRPSLQQNHSSEEIFIQHLREL